MSAPVSPTPDRGQHGTGEVTQHTPLQMRTLGSREGCRLEQVGPLVWNPGLPLPQRGRPELCDRHARRLLLEVTRWPGPRARHCLSTEDVSSCPAANPRTCTVPDTLPSPQASPCLCLPSGWRDGTPVPSTGVC